MANLFDVVVVGGIYREIGADPRRSGLSIAGSGLTASAIAARMGARTVLAASVGAEDESTARQILAVSGVDATWVRPTAGASGTFLFPPQMDDARPWPIFRPAESAPHTGLQRALPDASVYLLFGLPDLDPVSEGWLDGVPDASTIIWDRQGWLSRARDWRVPLGVHASQRIYLANEDEALTEFDAANLRQLLEKVPPPGFTTAIIKRGSAGCIYTSAIDTKVDEQSVDGFPIANRSTVGSGDAFAGALSAGIARGVELPDALAMSNAVAAAFLLEERDVLAVDLIRRAQDLVDGLGH